MNFEKYTERARGFVQAAQNLAMREGHPQLSPGPVLKVLLDDPEGLCAGLIDGAGGRSRDAHAAVEQWLAKQPKVSGSAAQPQATRDLMRFFDTAEKAADKVTAENAYEALKKYARDLTEAARDGKLDPVIGRDEEIRRTIQVLSRRTKNNPVLIGEPGVGKAAGAESLALRIVNGDAPE